MNAAVCLLPLSVAPWKVAGWWDDNIRWMQLSVKHLPTNLIGVCMLSSVLGVVRRHVGVLVNVGGAASRVRVTHTFAVRVLSVGKRALCR